MDSSELQHYLPVLIQLIIAILFAIASIGTALLTGKRGRQTRAKAMAYECGKDPEGPIQPRFSVKFYLVAMLFILFDIEIIFFYVWAIVYQQELASGFTILWAMLPFILLFAVGDAYAWKKGALDWTK